MNFYGLVNKHSINCMERNIIIHEAGRPCAMDHRFGESRANNGGSEVWTRPGVRAYVRAGPVITGAQQRRTVPCPVEKKGACSVVAGLTFRQALDGMHAFPATASINQVKQPVYCCYSALVLVGWCMLPCPMRR
jgi:hypothetical protein